MRIEFIGGQLDGSVLDSDVLGRAASV